MKVYFECDSSSEIIVDETNLSPVTNPNQFNDYLKQSIEHIIKRDSDILDATIIITKGYTIRDDYYVKYATMPIYLVEKKGDEYVWNT